MIWPPTHQFGPKQDPSIQFFFFLWAANFTRDSFVFIFLPQRIRPERLEVDDFILPSSMENDDFHDQPAGKRD